LRSYDYCCADGLTLIGLVGLQYARISEIEELQSGLDEWLFHYNSERTHQGKMCFGRTPLEMLESANNLWQDSSLN
jgi:hypothetical protein